jgi:exonuclease 3'-5' domain-containing protein 1
MSTSPSATEAPTPGSTGLIDTPTAISALVDILHNQPTTPPSLYLDLEGVNLSRHGTISILQIHISPLHQTYLIDIHTLASTAFTTPSATTSLTLRHILESATTPKVLFDVRHDSDALFALFGVRLAGVTDLQLMELATRNYSRRVLASLAKCIERDAVLSWTEQSVWMAAKKRGRRLFVPELGGRYEVLEERPLAEEIRRYCVQDVVFLPRLWVVYAARITGVWEGRVREASRERVERSWVGGFGGEGGRMTLGPEGWCML